MRLSSNECVQILLLEESEFAEKLLEKPLEIGFKESNLVVATSLKGSQNTFSAEILGITQDTLFARISLKSAFCEPINALCPLAFIEENALKVGDCIDWHIPENEIMVFSETK